MQRNNFLKSSITITIITATMLLAFSPCRAQKTAAKHVVKYFFGDSVAEHITTRPDTIGINAFTQYPALDSLETYLGRKLDGFKIVFVDYFYWITTYKNGRFVQENAYDDKGSYMYASYVNPATIPKITVVFKSGRDYFSRAAKKDTITLVNPVVPHANRMVWIVGKGLSLTTLGKNVFVLSMKDAPADLKNIILRIENLYDRSRRKSLKEEVVLPIR